jgi:hypothetical protein
MLIRTVTVSPVHIAPACVGFGEGSDHFGGFCFPRWVMPMQFVVS